MILIIDYGMGNLRSVEKAFQKVGADVRVSSNPADFARADKVVVPGVGSFDHAVNELKARKLWEPLKAWIAADKPYLGLCLGMQLLFERSAEGKETGLGVMKGEVERFPTGLKVPHMGWNTVKRGGGAALWKGIPEAAAFYFVHSFFVKPADQKTVAGETSYGKDFVSAIHKGRVFATQFHPEKSQEHGLRLLRNFAEMS